MKAENLALVLLLSTLMLWSSSVFAEGSFQKGVTEWGVSGGFGDNFHVHGNVAEDVEFYFLTPRWEKIFTDQIGPGVFGFVLEGFLSYARQDSKSRTAVGITPLLAYNIADFGKMTPFVELGIGGLYTTLEPEDFGSPFNFTPQAGIGLRYEMSHRCFLRFSYRIHHTSNAGLNNKDNRSIDSNFFSIGISFLR